MNAIDKYLTKLSPHGDKLMIDYLLSMPSPTYRKTPKGDVWSGLFDVPNSEFNNIQTSEIILHLNRLFVALRYPLHASEVDLLLPPRERKNIRISNIKTFDLKCYLKREQRAISTEEIQKALENQRSFEAARAEANAKLYVSTFRPTPRPAKTSCPLKDS